MRKKLKVGRGFELLVRDLEKALGREHRAKVESPLRLRDKTTGTLREFDVGITAHQAHHRIVLGLECRDRSRKVSVPDVEAFHTKCKDTGIHRGVIVSARGFFKTAIRKANRLDIGCLTLAEARSFNWLLATTFGHYERKLSSAIFLLGTGDAALDATIPDGTAYNASGDVVTEGERRSAQAGLAGQVKTSQEPHEGRMEITWLDCPWFLKDRDGKLHPVGQAVLRLSYSTTSRSVGLDLHFYRDEITGKLLKEIASIEVFGDGVRQGKLLLVHDHTGTEVIFVKDPAAGIFTFSVQLRLKMPPEAQSGID